MIRTKEAYYAGFGDPFSGLAKDRKVTKEELIRAIRFMVAAESGRSRCMSSWRKTDNKLAQEVLNDIAGEERSTQENSSGS